MDGSQRNLCYDNTDIIGTCEVASKWPLLAFFDRYCMVHLMLRLHWHVRPGRTVPARCCLVERASVNATGPNWERAGVGWPGPFDLSELARCGPVLSSSVNASRLLG